MFAGRTVILLVFLSFYHSVMCPKDVDGMANSDNLDQIALSRAV